VKAAGSSDIARIAADLTTSAMEALRESRPVFHTEADFQHALAWELHARLPAAKVRLEKRLSSESNQRLDLLVTTAEVSLAIELKYPVAALNATVDGETHVLREQGAPDQMRFSYVWDIFRLERLVAAGAADAGVAVLLSNVKQLWEQAKPSSRVSADTEFRLYEGRELAGRLSWSGDAKWWHNEGLPEAIELAGRYPLAWAPYSTVDGTGRGEFRWTMALVVAAPMDGSVSTFKPQ
jgi:hypothetical protein